MRLGKGNVYVTSLKARAGKTKEGIIFPVVLTFLLWNWETREQLELPARNEASDVWVELTDPWTEFTNLYQWW